MKKLAVIVPCYNEELVIAESYRRTREALHKLPVLTEIIYINDGSRDRTRLMLDEIAASDPQVKVIHFSRNFGHQPAVTAGINNCDADLAVILDADRPQGDGSVRPFSGAWKIYSRTDQLGRLQAGSFLL